MFPETDKHDEPKTRYSELVLMAAADVPALCREIERLVGFLDQTHGASLRDIVCGCPR